MVFMLIVLVLVVVLMLVLVLVLVLALVLVPLFRFTSLPLRPLFQRKPGVLPQVRSFGPSVGHLLRCLHASALQ